MATLLVNSTMITPDGAVIPYQVVGSSASGAPLIVLSNPLLTTWAIWSLFVAIFFSNPRNRKFRVLYYQTRGQTDFYGTRGITLDLLAGDIVGLLNTLKVQKVAAIIGDSIGGATALNFALRYPERTGSLVCTAIFANSPPGMQQAWEGRVDVARREGARSATGDLIIGDQLAKMTVQRWFTPQSFHGGAISRQLETIEKEISTSSLNGFAAITKALYNFDLRPSMTQSRVKAIFVVGNEDAPLPSAMKNMAAGFGRGAEYAVIQGAGHIPMVEKAEEFVNIVTNFLGGYNAIGSTGNVNVTQE